MREGTFVLVLILFLILIQGQMVFWGILLGILFLLLVLAKGGEKAKQGLKKTGDSMSAATKKTFEDMAAAKPKAQGGWAEEYAHVLGEKTAEFIYPGKMKKGEDRSNYRYQIKGNIWEKLGDASKRMLDGLSKWWKK